MFLYEWILSVKYFNGAMIFDVENDPFYLKEDGKTILDHEVLYLSVIGALIYLTNCT